MDLENIICIIPRFLIIIIALRKEGYKLHIYITGSLHTLQVQVIKKISIKRAHALYKLKIYIYIYYVERFD